MSNAADEIRARTEAFVASLAVLIRQAALEAASAALGGGTTVAAPAKVASTRGRGRPRKVAAPAPAAKAPVAKAVPAAKAPVAKKAAAPKRAAGEKRPAAELAKLIEGLDRYIHAHPGVRMDVLSKALATPAKELRFPAVKLVRAKRVRTEGQRQNMAYFPA